MGFFANRAVTNFQSEYNANPMFNRYTEKARRVMFVARHEASQFGSPCIETEHLLLGLLGEDKALANRFLPFHASFESIRKQIEGRSTIRDRVSSRVDLPLSNECKRVLAYSAEEAERLSHNHIGTEHLLLGLLREDKCFAAEILSQLGLRLSTIREQLDPSSQGGARLHRHWASTARLRYWSGAAVQLLLFVLLALVLTKSGIREQHLFVIAVAWFAVALAWLRMGRSFSFLFLYGKRNRLAIAATYIFLFLYQILVIGWVIPLGVGLYRAVKR